jgi:hypothetical protein
MINKSRRHQSRISQVLRTLALLCVTVGAAEAWTGATPDGAEVRVDPGTRRATRIQGDQAVPLWDGVHRMDDGSVVIIRRGTVIPNAQMLDTWAAGAAQPDPLDGRPCEQLERRACGRDQACGSSAACLKARTLLNVAREEQRRLPIGVKADPDVGTNGRCAAALTAPDLETCGADRPAGGARPCTDLVERVCGADQRCAASPACPPARQLLAQEQTEQPAESGALTPSATQCQEALASSFFAPCP